MIKETLSKFISFLVLLTAVIAMLLLAIAAVLIWRPELLLGILRTGVILVCILAGSCMLTPTLIVVVARISHARREKQIKINP